MNEPKPEDELAFTVGEELVVENSDDALPLGERSKLEDLVKLEQLRVNTNYPTLPPVAPEPAPRVNTNVAHELPPSPELPKLEPEIPRQEPRVNTNYPKLKPMLRVNTRKPPSSKLPPPESPSE